MDYSRFLRRRLRGIGLKPKDAKRVAVWFQYQIRHQGLTQAVVHFKNVGDQIVNAISGESHRSPWVKTHGRYPKVLSFLRTYPADVQLRIAKIARAVRFEKLTTSQVEKFHRAVTAPYGGTEHGLREMTRLQNLGVSHLGYRDFPVPVRYREITREFRRTMSRSGPTPFSMEPPVLESLVRVKSSPFQGLPNWEQAFEPASVPVLSLAQMPEVDSYVGKIFVSQEGGGKARFYAAPYTAYQCLLTPLHEFLSNLRKQFPTDCTFDQVRGALWAQSRLAAGKPVVSADTRNATDRYPYEAQKALLRQLGVPEIWITVLDFIVEGDWELGTVELQEAFSSLSLRWNVGQPLGIRPSMSLYSLAHNALLRGIAIEKGLDPNDSFVILGDDVAMDPALFERYHEVLTNAGVEFSYEKTHNSAFYAEFAGYQVTPEIMIRPGKWAGTKLTNHVSVALDLGKVLDKEVFGDFVTVQKLALFRVGKYSPPVENWSRYIQANMALESELLMDVVPGLPPFRLGLLKVLQKQTGLLRNNLVKAGQADYLAPFGALPRNSITENWKIVSNGGWLVHQDSVFCINQSIQYCLIALLEMIDYGMLTYAEALERFQLCRTLGYRELYAPPKVDRQSPSAYHHVLLRLVQQYNLA